MADFDIGDLNAKVISFADAMRLYTMKSYDENCDSLQSDLNCVYDNMVLTTTKYSYFSTNVFITSDYVNDYVIPKLYVIDNVNHLKYMFMTLDIRDMLPFDRQVIECCVKIKS